MVATAIPNQNDHFEIFFQLAKVDEAQRRVMGRATQEVPDAVREICDFESSKPYFEKWSQAAEKRSGGKSKGNMREMHHPVAAGKVLGIDFNEAEKAIDIDTYVSDDQTWKKILDGTLTGFSVGGNYAKRWMDGSFMRYTANPSEISYVDAPCVPTATYNFIKTDGTQELRKVLGGEVLEKVVPIGPQDPEIIESGQVETEILPDNVQATQEVAAGHGIEAAGVKNANQPAEPYTGWLDKFETVVHGFSESVEKLDKVQKAEAADQDKALNELKARGARVGIARREGEPQTPPKDYPTDPAMYADPANWSYPCDEPRGSVAVGRYNGGGGRSKYSPHEWAVLGRRIASLASKSTGTKYVFSPDEKKITNKDEKDMNTPTLTKDSGASLLGDVRNALNSAIEAIQNDPDQAKAMLMQALAAVDVGSDVQGTASPSDGDPHGPTGSSPDTLAAMKASGTASPTAGSGPDKPDMPAHGAPPQTPQQSSSSSSYSESSSTPDYAKLAKDLDELKGLVKDLVTANLNKAAAPAGTEKVAEPAKQAVPANPAGDGMAPVQKNAPAGDLAAIISGGNGGPSDDLMKVLTKDPITGLHDAIEKSHLTVDELQNRAQQALIKIFVDDGRISARSHQIYNPPMRGL